MAWRMYFAKLAFTVVVCRFPCAQFIARPSTLAEVQSATNGAFARQSVYPRYVCVLCALVGSIANIVASVFEVVFGVVVALVD